MSVFIILVIATIFGYAYFYFSTRAEERRQEFRRKNRASLLRR